MSSLSANYNVAKLKLCVFVSVCGRHLHVYLSRGIVHVSVLLEYLTNHNDKVHQSGFGKKKKKKMTTLPTLWNVYV